MTWLLPLALIVVLNPARVSLLRPLGAARRDAVPLVVAVAGAIVTAALSGPVLDLLNLEPESFRIAAGAVRVAGGGRVLLWPLRRWDEARRLVPLVWPILLSAELLVATVSWAADDGVAWAGFSATIAVVACGLVPPATEVRRRTVAAAARLLGAGTVAIGVSRIISGVFSV